MTTSDTKEPLRLEAGAAQVDDAQTAEVRAPDRPPLTGKEAAPVLVKLPPPFFVRLSQIAWLMSLIAGGVAIIYLFVIRQAQLPEIEDLVKAVDGSRADATYTTAADIVFWSVFTPLVAIVLAQIAMQVSFASRRANVRWWQFGSVLFQAGVFLIARELVVFGERALPLERILLVQLGLAVLGLLISLLPQALRWTARQHDVRRGGPVTPASDGQL
ncbi:hypothetical protein [Microbacterium terricola]|uniref:Uncharacterized protein n=1 Tax=Microbacterium terricola TaxID=344163 RepID=A0ABM8E1W7_9MICO|nr:hypothetical protein [Microbacterium terricola]UYK40353.1 hypothetical protein OAU46_01490 [Microbacterium terricola]BDV31933.1 hypothetical protein Microterr_25930 [Microbacterium terricola]